MRPPQAFTVRASRLSPILWSEVSVSSAAGQSSQDAKTAAMTVRAVWDTGAMISCITQRVADDLQLKPVDKVSIQGVTGSENCPVYLANVRLPNGVNVHFLRVVTGRMDPAFDMILGMDVILLGDFSISNFAGKTTFTFRIPSQGETDYVQEVRDQEKQKPAHSEKPGRNSPCTCGSGKKYKHCHGK